MSLGIEELNIEPCFNFRREKTNFETVFFSSHEICVVSSLYSIFFLDTNNGKVIREIDVVEKPKNLNPTYGFYSPEYIGVIEKWKEELVLVSINTDNQILGYCVKTGEQIWDFRGGDSFNVINDIISVPEEGGIVFSTDKALCFLSFSSKALLLNFLDVDINDLFSDTFGLNGTSRLVHSLSFKNCLVVNTDATNTIEVNDELEHETVFAVKLVNYKEHTIEKEFNILSFLGMDFLGKGILAFCTFMHNQEENLVVITYAREERIDMEYSFTGQIEVLNMTTTKKIRTILLDSFSNSPRGCVLPINDDYLLCGFCQTKSWLRVFSLNNPSFEPYSEIKLGNLEVLETPNEDGKKNINEIILVKKGNYNRSPEFLLNTQKKGIFSEVKKIRICPLILRSDSIVLKDRMERMEYLKGLLEMEDIPELIRINLMNTSLEYFFKIFLL